MKQVTLLIDFSNKEKKITTEYCESCIDGVVGMLQSLLTPFGVTVERLPDVKYDDSVAGDDI